MKLYKLYKNVTQVPIAIKLYILKVFIFNADRAHLKKSAQITNCIGIVSTNEIIAIRGITIFPHGIIHGKKSYSIKIIIGKLNSTDTINFIFQCFVSLFLFSVSLPLLSL